MPLIRDKIRGQARVLSFLFAETPWKHCRRHAPERSDCCRPSSTRVELAGRMSAFRNPAVTVFSSTDGQILAFFVNLGGRKLLRKQRQGRRHEATNPDDCTKQFEEPKVLRFYLGTGRGLDGSGYSTSVLAGVGKATVPLSASIWSWMTAPRDSNLNNLKSYDYLHSLTTIQGGDCLR